LVDDARDEAGKLVLLGEGRRGGVDFGKHPATIAGGNGVRRLSSRRRCRGR
jgi:hypothetical protein